MVEKRVEPSYYDVPFGISSSILTTGLNVVATTAAYYHGLSVKASAADCTITIYDNASTTSGNIVDLVFVDFSLNPATRVSLYNPIYAKNGIAIDVSELGTKGVCFYGPKG